MNEHLEFEVSSGNVFADLGLPNPEERLAKSQLVLAISDAMRSKGLTQVQAAEIMSVDQPTLSKLLRGRTSSFSLDRLAKMLTSIGRNVTILVEEGEPDALGRLTVTAR